MRSGNVQTVARTDANDVPDTEQCPPCARMAHDVRSHVAKVIKVDPIGDQRQDVAVGKSRKEAVPLVIIEGLSNRARCGPEPRLDADEAPASILVAAKKHASLARCRCGTRRSPTGRTRAQPAEVETSSRKRLDVSRRVADQKCVARGDSPCRRRKRDQALHSGDDAGVRETTGEESLKIGSGVQVEAHGEADAKPPFLRGNRPGEEAGRNVPAHVHVNLIRWFARGLDLDLSRAQPAGSGPETSPRGHPALGAVSADEDGTGHGPLPVT